MSQATALSRFSERLWRIIGSVSISTKILGIVLALVVLLGVGVTLQVRTLMIRTLEARLAEQSVSIAHDVAARSTDLILINDVFSLHHLLRDTQANNTDVRYAFILDEKGRVLAHTFGTGFPTELLDANTSALGEDHRSQVLMTDEGPIWDTSVPIFEGRAGTVRIGLSESGIRQAITTITIQLLLTTLLVSVVGIAAAALLTWVLTRPIQALVHATEAVARGDLSQRVDRWANDEIGALADAFNTMTSELALAEQAHAERDQLRAQLLERVISAQEDERKRIARELHDETSQSITSLLVGLRTLGETCPMSDSQQQIEDLRQIAGATLEGVRTLALELRPSVLDDLGLVAALTRYVSDYQNRYHLAVDVATLGLDENRLPPAVETALYRIVQESLTNIARHARASTVSVLLEHREGRIRAIIEDDGCGFDPVQVRASAGGLGLYGMQERVELLGGVFRIESSNAGTAVVVEVPVEGSAFRNGNQSLAG